MKNKLNQRRKKTEEDKMGNVGEMEMKNKQICKKAKRRKIENSRRWYKVTGVTPFLCSLAWAESKMEKVGEKKKVNKSTK